MTMLLFGLLVVAGICRLLGGKFSHLAQLRLQGTRWLIVLIAAQLVSLGLLRQEFPQLAGVILIVTYASLLYLGWVNRRVVGMPLVLVGIALNFGVVSANGGAMPTTLEALSAIGRTDQLQQIPAPSGEHNSIIVSHSKDIVNNNAPLLFLGDVIVVPLPGRFATIMSLGDVVIELGLIWLCSRVMGVPFSPRVRLARL